MQSSSKPYDLVVVGHGIAGLSAAVSAAEAGASVVVLERAPKEDCGGNTRWTDALMRLKSVDAVADDFEDHFAANAGHQIGWEQAADEGLIDRNKSEVEWVVGPETGNWPCATCRPMDGVRRPLDGTWSVEIRTESGIVKATRAIKIPNQVHPNCRCTAKLVLD